MGPGHRPPAWSPGALLLGASGVLVFWVFVWPASVGPPPDGRPLWAWDLYSYFLPKFAFGTEELLAGRLPLWNRFEFAGIPFLATAQPAALYPPKIAAFALLDPDRALVAFLVGHHLLAAVGMGLLLARHGLGRLAIAAGTLYLTLSHPILLSNHHPVRIASLAWVPWLFLASDGVCRTRDGRRVAVLALVVALQLTAGYPEFTLDCAALAALQALVLHRAGAPYEALGRSLPRLVGGFALGALAAGLQVLPTAALLMGAERAAAAEDAVGFFTRPGMRAGIVGLALWGFPGLVALAWAALGRRAAAVPAAGLALCVGLTAVGWSWLRAVPGFSMIRHPFVWSFLAQFFLAWLVALGADRLSAGARGLPARAARGLVATTALALALVAALHLGGLAGLPAGIGAFLFPIHQALALPARAVPAASAVLAGSGLLVAAALVNRRRRLIVGAAVTILTLGQLAAFPFGPPLPSLERPESPLGTSPLLADASPPPAGRVLSLPALAGGAHLTHRTEHLFGTENSLMPPRFRLLLRRLGANLVLGRLDWARLARAKGLLEALDVRYVVAPTRMANAFGARGFERVGPTVAHLTVYRDRAPGARAWVVHAATVVPSPDMGLDRLLADDFDPRHEVLLEVTPRGSYPSRATTPPTRATVHRRGPTEVVVEADTQAPGILVLADSCAPGWLATIDGDAAAVLCTNVLTRGVELPAGRHVVRFAYRPLAARLGVAATLVGLLAIAALAWRRPRSAG